MSRLQLALNVDDLEGAVDFYSRLFGTGPAKRRPGYANFAVTEPPLKLVLFENPGQGGTLNHLGVEVEDVAQVSRWSARVGAELDTTDQAESTCCFARQEKFWVQHTPDQVPWEVYAVLADAPVASDQTACCAS